MPEVQPGIGRSLSEFRMNDVSAAFTGSSSQEAVVELAKQVFVPLLLLYKFAYTGVNLDINRFRYSQLYLTIVGCNSAVDMQCIAILHYYLEFIETVFAELFYFSGYRKLR